MSCVRPPMVRREACEAEGLQQRLELQKDLILPTAKDIRQDGSCMMIDRMPQPALVPFLPNKAPHLVSLCLASALDVHRNLVWLQGTQQRRVDRLEGRFCLPECTEHGVGTDAQPPRCIAHATGIEAHVNDGVLHLGHVAPIAVVEPKTLGDTRRVLAQGALCAAARFATFDDLGALTMWTANRDRGHWRLLAFGPVKIRPSVTSISVHLHV